MEVIKPGESFPGEGSLTGDSGFLDPFNQTFSYLLPSFSNGSVTSLPGPLSPSSDSPDDSSPFRETSNMTSRTRDEGLAKIEMGVLALIFVATLLGNAIVVLGIYFRRQKMSRMYYFILHLSLADIFTAFFNVGTQFAMELTFPSFVGPNALCKFVKYMQILGPYSSSYVLVMTALDRYQAICYPLSNCTWTAKQSKVMLAIAWTISLLFCVPQLFIFSLQEVMGYPDCWANFPVGGQEVYVTWYAISFFIVPLLILVFAYTCICRTIWTNFSMKAAAHREEYDVTPSPPPPSHQAAPPGIDSEDDSVFQGKGPLRCQSIRDRPSSTLPGDGSDSRVLCVNRLSSKQLEVSWKRGNVSTNTHSTDFNSNGAIPRRSGDNFTVISPRRDSGGVEDEALLERRGGDKVLNGVNHGVKKVEKKGAYFPKISSYKWPSNKNKMAAELLNKAPTTFIVGTKNGHLGVSQKFSARNRLLTNDSQPRTSSIKGISRAKIKTVKLTVTVICCYIFCSSPFITAQLWVTFDPNAYQSKFYTGTTFTILTLLASLNSCVNPWIFLFFNPNLLQDFLRGMGCKRKFSMGRFRRRASSSSPVTQKTSPGHLRGSNTSSFNSHRHVNGHHISRNLTPSLGSSGKREEPNLPGRRLISTNSSSGGRDASIHSIVIPAGHSVEN